MTLSLFNTIKHIYHIICAVARIALVKPEKARGVEDVLLRAAQSGQIAEKVSVTFFSSSTCIFFPFPDRKSILGNPVKESIDSKKEAMFDAFFAGFGGKAHIIVGADQQPNNQTNQSHGNSILFLQQCS